MALQKANKAEQQAKNAEKLAKKPANKKTASRNLGALKLTSTKKIQPL